MNTANQGRHARGLSSSRGRAALTIALIAAGFLCVVAIVFFAFLRGRPARYWGARDEAGQPWNVLLVSLDTTRPDFLEACGGKPVATPALDRVLGDGFLMTEMITPAPNTLPAHASLFTGLNPYEHGVRENVEHFLPSGARTLAEAFSESGYTTAAFVAAFVLDERFGLAQGFDLYEDRLWGEPGSGPQTVELRGGIVATRAVRWIGDYASRRHSGAETRPFFLFVHFFDAHAPYVPPSPYDRAYPGQPYAGELAYQDACLGAVLDALEAHGEAGRTLVWVVSDHGESLGDHGEPQHSIFIYDSTVRVVSVMHPPAPHGYRAGKPRARIAQGTSLISVAPTLLALAGLDSALLPAEGESLLPLLTGAAQSEEPVYCESLSPLVSYHWAPLYAVRTSAWKYIRAPQPELYNLAADPRETKNLYNESQAKREELAAALDEFAASGSADQMAAQRTPTPAERERLQSLGYVSGAHAGGDANRTGVSAGEDAADPDGAGLPDPKTMLQAFDRRYQAAQKLMREQRYPEAIAILEEAVKIDPFNNSLYFNLATTCRAAGRPVDAGRAYRRVLEIQPQSPRAWHGWGQALLQNDRADSAVWAFENAMALQPSSPDPWSGLAGARWVQGRYREAAADFDSALARGGDPMVMHGLLARLYREALPDPVEAKAHLEAYARLVRMTPERASAQLPRVR